MPKKPRLKGNNLYHHIYAWGNDRHPVFKTETHYEKYLAFLELFGMQYVIDVIAYALMEWHVHLFIYDKNGKVSQFMNNLHSEYARFFNKETGRVGHVFGERFNNKVVQVNSYGLWLSRYIHRQPVDAGIVNDPKDYPWTSYRDYIGLVSRDFVRPDVILEQFGCGHMVHQRYAKFVLGLDDGPVDWVQPSGVVVGDEGFVKRLKSEKEKELDSAQGSGSVDFKKIAKEVSKRLNVEVGLLVNPVGRVYRRLRGEVCRILVNEYGLSLRVVGKLLGLSVSGVWKALSREQNKGKQK